MTTRPVNIRFPIDLYSALQEYAKANSTTISNVIFTACENFLEASAPGLCPSCHYQNEPETRYCGNCGDPLTDEAKTKLFEIGMEMFSHPDALKKLVDRSGGMELLEKNPPNTPDQMATHMLIKLQDEKENLQSQLDELKPIVAWARKKMEEETG